MNVGSPISSGYAYSTARVKAMEARLIGEESMKGIVQAKDISTILSMLAQTEYKKNLEEFGGLNIKSNMIDFALSKNLALNVGKLITITPMEEKSIIRAIAGKWDIYNAEIAMEAKASGKKFEDISKYIIDYGLYNVNVIKDIMNEASVEGLIERMMINSPYKDVLYEALEVYRRNKDVVEANMLIDKLYYSKLGRLMPRIRNVSPESAFVVKLDIDMRNLLLMIRAKKYSIDFSEIKDNFIKGGELEISELQSLYESSNNIYEIAKNAKVFDLGDAAEDYRNGRSKGLFGFEIEMRNQIFRKSMTLLKHALLSFGAIVAYAYIKEIEVFTLRILISGKNYGLSQEEISRMMVWKG
ncbi:MAG: V-type ATPase subunit [Candidatus Micrarchaeia archaeon]